MSSIPPCSGVMQGGTDSAAADASEFFGPTSLTGDNGGGGEQASETESAIDRASPRCKGLFISPLQYRSVCLADENLEGHGKCLSDFCKNDWQRLKCYNESWALQILTKLLLYTICHAILWHLHFGQTFAFTPYCTPSSGSQLGPSFIQPISS